MSVHYATITFFEGAGVVEAVRKSKVERKSKLVVHILIRAWVSRAKFLQIPHYSFTLGLG